MLLSFTGVRLYPEDSDLAFQEVDLMAFQQAWLTRGIAGLLKQLAPAEFPPEFQTSLANRREFVAPRAHTSSMRALAEQRVFNSCYRLQARLLWWSATE